MVVREADEQSVQLSDEQSNASPLAARKLGGIDEYETVMGLTSLAGGIHEWHEVRHVLGDDGASLLLGHGEDSRVGQRPEFPPFGHRGGVMAATTKLLRDRSRIHLVDQEPQPSAACARSQAAR